ncbi:MAG: LytTR family DNA-binding domain-containing protein [bacterium]|nr:LytTR family DNA-binding domain-containing protein [bacterium]
MNIAICDDDALVLTQLHTYISDYFNKNMMYVSIHCFHSGEEFLKNYRPGVYQLLFLDIYMKELTGVDVAKRIREKDDSLEIIFLTVSEEYFQTAYQNRILEYLIKPVTQEQIDRLMNRIQRLFLDAQHYIDIVYNRTNIRIFQQSILWIEVYGHTTTIHTKQGSYQTRMTLTSIFEQLSSPPFYRISKSQVVNFQLTDFLDSDSIHMVDGSRIQIPSDPRYNKSIRKQYFDYLFLTGGTSL